MQSDPIEPGSLRASSVRARGDGRAAPRSRREARQRAEAERIRNDRVAPGPHSAAPSPTAEQPVDLTVDPFDAAVHALFARHRASGAGRTRRAADAAPPTAGRRADARARRRTPHRLRRLTALTISASAVIAVGLLTVSLTLPVDAVASPQTHFTGAGTPAQVSADADGGDAAIQAYVTGSRASGVAGAALGRSTGYSTMSVAQLEASMAGSTDIRNISSAVFVNNPLCPVQWPFAVGVPISFGFGPRPGEFHEGVDFTPGAGAHVQSIAAGTVRVASQSYQGYGVAVIIDHVIDGQHWASLYGHMEYGSLQVHAGQTVKAGQYIGRTGDTGHSFGAHTHVEIRENGVTPIDPLPWLRAHNQC